MRTCGDCSPTSSTPLAGFVADRGSSRVGTGGIIAGSANLWAGTRPRRQPRPARRAWAPATILRRSDRHRELVLICAGPSFGAYQAVHFALRHPELVGRVLGMGEIYDITRFSAGFHDANVYHNNPMVYIANERDPDLGTALGQTGPARRADLGRLRPRLGGLGTSVAVLHRGARLRRGSVWASGRKTTSATKARATTCR